MNIPLILDRVQFYASDAVVTLANCICRPSATLKINGRSYNIDRLLGEGGFSFVYLITDTTSGRRYALKKIQSAEGLALKEIEAYRRFKHPNIIQLLDSANVQEGEGKIIYLFLPYYSRGNLQDVINANAVNGGRLEQRRLLSLFHGACLAVRAMHQYRPTHGYSVASEFEPYAHRDIKPANIMISDDDTAVLMDFGSTVKARIDIQTRQQALLEQDFASEHCSMPYRAPELFDVKTGRTLDEKVDIWSLGCTLFAVAYGHSPFEIEGSSIAMAAGSGRYRHPEDAPEPIKCLIDAMLVVEPDQRPDIQKVIDLVEAIME